MNTKKQTQSSIAASLLTKALYGSEEVVKLLGVSRPTLYREIKRGALKIRKIGRRTVFHVDDLNAYLTDLPSLPEAKFHAHQEKRR